VVLGRGGEACGEEEDELEKFGGQGLFRWWIATGSCGFGVGRGGRCGVQIEGVKSVLDESSFCGAEAGGFQCLEYDVSEVGTGLEAA
jgi:hypothetical protein